MKNNQVADPGTATWRQIDTMNTRMIRLGKLINTVMFKITDHRADLHVRVEQKHHKKKTIERKQVQRDTIRVECQPERVVATLESLSVQSTTFQGHENGVFAI